MAKQSTDELPDDFWAARVVVYREEEAIAAAIASSKKFKVDMSLLRELKGYFPHLDNGERKLKTIRGPADLDRGLEVADKMLTTKDRANYILLVYENYKGKLERLHSIVQANLLAKREVLNLKNEAQRKAIVSLTCPEIEDRLSRVSRILDAAQRVVQNTNQTYNILKTQVEIIKEMMYEAGLTGATRRGGKLADSV